MAIELETDFAFGDYVIDRADERLVGPAGPVKLGNKAYRVLLQLVEQSGRLLTKDALFSTVWDGTIVSESALTSTVKELRRALGDESRTPRYVESVYGRGYRFIAETTLVARAAPAARVAEPARPAGPASSPAEPAQPGRPALVLVSAFNDEAVRARHPFCAAGLREEVLSGLARFREIQLVADERPERESAADRPAPSDRDYQLTATLLPDGDGVKVVARAKRLADGRIVWAETMALADTGAAAGVERIVRRIAGAALPAVDEDIFLTLPHETDDFYDRYLLAKRRSIIATSYAEAFAAADALEQLIAERPDFGLAYPPLVRLYNTDFGYTGLGSTGPAERAKALELAKAGLAADPGNVHAHTVLGFCHLWHDERDMARECFEQTLTLNPYNPVRLNEVATGMAWLGKIEKSRDLFDYSLMLQPIKDDHYYEDHGELFFLEGRHDEAAALIRRMKTRRLWSSLYEALCDPDDARLRAWREWVTICWIGDDPPSIAELSAWIALHRAFAQPFKGEFMALVHDRLERAASV